MNPLNSRKQLLITESELNRVQLVQEWQTIVDDVSVLANRARTISSFALAAAPLVAGLAFFYPKKSSSAVDKKSSWWRTIFKSAGLFYTFWQASRPRDYEQKEK